MLVRTRILLPEELLARVDQIAGKQGRSQYIAEAIRERLARDERMEAMRAAIGSWRDSPLFPTSEAVVEWVRELRREVTDPGPE